MDHWYTENTLNKTSALSFIIQDLSNTLYFSSFFWLIMLTQKEKVKKVEAGLEE